MALPRPLRSPICTTLPEVFAGQARQAIAAGHGADSYARLIEVIEK